MTLTLAPDRTYIIAEAGVNHDGNYSKAEQLIDIAAEAKADAVKFQLFNADELASSDAPLATYQERSGEENQQDMLRRLTLPLDDYRKLKAYAESKGLDFITTPFDATSATFLASLDVKAIKIPSGEITNLPFMEHVAGLGVFTIVSTGMSNMKEVADAIAPFIAKKTPFAILHCVSSYPAPANEINLRAMDTMRQAFKVPVGYSDHTTGIEVAVASAAMGASILEKHFTINRNDPGPDHAASLEREELISMVQSIRSLESARGDGVKQCQPCEKNTRDVARRSIILATPVKKGDAVTTATVKITRPGTGLAPKQLSAILGKTYTADLPAGTVLQASHIA